MEKFVLYVYPHFHMKRFQNDLAHMLYRKKLILVKHLGIF